MGFSVNRNPIAMRVDDYHAARAELESRGVVFTSDTIDSGVCHMASFEDTDGNAPMILLVPHDAGVTDGVTAAAGRRPRHYETAVHGTVTKTVRERHPTASRSRSRRSPARRCSPGSGRSMGSRGS